MDVFKTIFPDSGQDIEFFGDVRKREKRTRANELIREFRRNLVDKTTIPRIDGTLFFKLNIKKKYYPTKKDMEMAPFSRSVYTWDKFDELLDIRDGEARREVIEMKVLYRIYGEKYYY